MDKIWHSYACRVEPELMNWYKKKKCDEMDKIWRSSHAEWPKWGNGQKWGQGALRMQSDQNEEMAKNGDKALFACRVTKMRKWPKMDAATLCM